MRVLHIDEFPQAGNYETMGSFMMYMLRKIPERTDFVKYASYKFEVVNIFSYKIDQLLVTPLSDKPIVTLSKIPDEAPPLA
jgi:CBS domain containing-hemolysin-like protein